MTIPPKYEDVVAKLDEALAREAVLREELRLAKKLQTTTDAIVVMVDGQRDHWIEKCGAIKQRLTVAEQRAVTLEAALKFYSDGDHLLLADADAWDTCSGEPVNFLHDEAGTASVEDGSIAKAALKPAAELPPMTPVEGDKLPPIGCKMFIHLSSSDSWVEHTVAGYYVWNDLQGDTTLHRVFVRVRDSAGYLNARLLKDIRLSAEG